ncbi:hypothetical protein TQ38_018595 [Novosphingobium sp. P6W]|jgi:hypothetical protein|nr:hypothetical protein TQ38_002525 [Novosphingobium sp. P6W]AXB78626.1 hypothetical protein TQ38_018595 [Novosphingobium sp. P6W]
MRRAASYSLVMLIGLGAATSMPISTSAQPTKAPVQVQCAGGRQFLLQAEQRRARVRVGERQLNLVRKSSLMGQQYHSPQATLILDGDFIAFVPKDDAGWQDCRVARTIPASAPNG